MTFLNCRKGKCAAIQRSRKRERDRVSEGERASASECRIWRHYQVKYVKMWNLCLTCSFLSRRKSRVRSTWPREDQQLLNISQARCGQKKERGRERERARASLSLLRTSNKHFAKLNAMQGKHMCPPGRPAPLNKFAQNIPHIMSHLRDVLAVYDRTAQSAGTLLRPSGIWKTQLVENAKHFQIFMSY